MKREIYYYKGINFIFFNQYKTIFKFCILILLVLTCNYSYLFSALAQSSGLTLQFYLSGDKTLASEAPNTLFTSEHKLILNLENDETQEIYSDLDLENGNHITIIYSDTKNILQFFIDGKIIKTVSLISKNFNIFDLKNFLEESNTNGNISEYKFTNSILSSKRIKGEFQKVRSITSSLMQKSPILYQTGPQLTMILLHVDPINYDNMCASATNSTAVITWTDQSGTADNGTLTNFTLPSNGNSGWEGGSPSSLRFDGTNDYVSIANESNFDFTSNFSISVWFKADTVSTAQTIISKWDFNSSKRGWELNVGETANSVTFKVQDSSMGTPKSVTIGSINAGTWYHAVGVHNGSTIRLHINAGTPTSTTSSVCRTNNNTVNIGRESGTATKYFDGSVGNIRIYNVALSNSEITEIYNLGKNGGTCDSTPPTVSTYSPADNATYVNPTSNLILTFNESVQKGTGNITIKKTSDNSTLETIDVTSGNVTVSTTMVTINPTADLPENTGVYVNIASGAIKDLSNNNYAGIASTTTWNFTIGDSVAPTVSSYSPADGDTEIAVDSNLVLTFDEDIQKGTGNIIIKKVSDNSTLQTIPVGNSGVTVSTNTLTINPPLNLPDSTGIYINIDSTAIKDLSSNNYAGISNNSTWNFTTVDLVAPAVSSYNPTDELTGVPITSNLVLTFNEDVQAGTGNITIKQISDNSTIQTIDITSGDVSITGPTVTINPPSDLPIDTALYINIPSGAITDIASNSYAGISNNSTWNFRTEDLTPPTVSSYSPADNATDIAIASNLILTFDEIVQKGTGNIIIKKISDDSTVQTIDITSTDVTVSGSTVTINPPSDLPSDTALYINIDSGAIKDTSTNNYAGISNNSTWNFTTVDTTAPTVSSLSPIDNATDIAVGSNLVIIFDESVKKGTGSITIKKSSDDSVLQTINVTSTAVTVSGNTVTINPPSDLPDDTGIYINITSGAIKDLANNNFSGISNNSTWDFTTIDLTAPTVSTYSPTDGSSGVSITSNLILTFNEDVQAGTGNITIKKSSDNSIVQTIDVTSGDVSITGPTVTINPPSNLPSSTAVYINIDSGAIEDLLGNNYTGISNATTWNFATQDLTPPAISTLSPSDNSTGASLSGNLTITFNESVQKGTGNIVLKKVSDDSVIETIDVTSGNVTVSGATVTINPTADFVDSTDIYVNIDSGAIQDVFGNVFTGISDNSTWNFTTVDTTNPTVVSFNPLDDATNVSTSNNLTIAFDEDIKKGTGNILIKKVSDDSTVQSISVTSSAVTISGDTVTINPTSNLPGSTALYVTLASGVIKDLSNNPYAGISNSTTWNFTTIDDTSPTLESADITDDTLELNYNENLNSGSTPDIADFIVTVNGSSASLNMVSITNDIVTITLSSAVSYGDEVTVTYTAGVNPIEDLIGNDAANLTDQIAENDTTGGNIDLGSVSDVPTAGFSSPSLPNDFGTLLGLTIAPNKVPVIAGSDGSYEIQSTSTFYSTLGNDGDALTIKVTNDLGDIIDTVNATINEANGNKVIVSDTAYSNSLPTGDGYIVIYDGITPLGKIPAQTINNFTNDKFLTSQIADVKSTIVVSNKKKNYKMIISGINFPSLGKKISISGQEVNSNSSLVNVTFSPVKNATIKKITVDENGKIITISGKFTGSFSGDTKAVITVITPVGLKTRVIDIPTGCSVGSCAYRNQP